MKILQICPKFHYSAASGSTRVAYSISEKLASRGHSVTVYTSNMWNKYTRVGSGVEEIHEVKVHRFQTIGTMVTREMKIFVTPMIIPRLKSEIRFFDVIHLHEYRSFQNIVVHHYARKYDVPYVLQAHGTLPRIGKEALKLLYDVSFGYKILKDATKVIALSQMEAQQYRDMGVPEEKIAVIPNGIELSEYADLPTKGSFKRKFGVDENEKIVTYLGRIHESKGLDLLAKAFEIVLRDFSNVWLVVIGPDDGYASIFSKLISGLEMKGKVLLTGFVEKKDKLAALIDSDIFVTPRFHGFPVTFLEACLAGCPIVTTSTELDWIHNNVGYVVENSPIALARAISKILQDGGMSEKFQRNCRSTIKNFDISRIASLFENSYEAVSRKIG